MKYARWWKTSMFTFQRIIWSVICFILKLWIVNEESLFLSAVLSFRVEKKVIKGNEKGLWSWFWNRREMFWVNWSKYQWRRDANKIESIKQKTAFSNLRMKKIEWKQIENIWHDHLINNMCHPFQTVSRRSSIPKGIHTVCKNTHQFKNILAFIAIIKCSTMFKFLTKFRNQMFT